MKQQFKVLLFLPFIFLSVYFFSLKSDAQPIRLWGTTINGGPTGAGEIFKIAEDGSGFQVVYNFQGTPTGTGTEPWGDLMLCSNGLIYGTDYSGGDSATGVIFSIDPITYNYIKVHDFHSLEGYLPYSGLIEASDHKLYGVTRDGGTLTDGVLYSMDPVNNSYNILHNFGSEGRWPQGKLLFIDSTNTLYGLCSGGGVYGYGVIFSYDISGGIYSELFDFNDTIGSGPEVSLLLGNDGKLYGNTYTGGANQCGVIFSYDMTTNTFSKLYDFVASTGKFPMASLIQANNGKLYGTTYSGGSNINYGVLFSYDLTDSTYTDLLNYNGFNGGANQGSLLKGSDGKIYGINYENEYIFSFDTNTNTQTILLQFNMSNGFQSPAGLIELTH